MTVRSTRKAAEQRVIDSAYLHRLAHQPPPAGEAPSNTFTRRLRANEQLWHDVSELEALALPNRPVFSNNSTDTSAAAPLANISGDALMVYTEIEIRHNLGVTGLTCDQIEQLLGRTHQSMSARVNQLRDNGWIIDSGLKRTTRSGRQAIVWTPTRRALDRKR